MYGYGSDNVNGQLVPMRTADAYAPRAYGPTTLAAPGSVATVPPMLAPGGMVGGALASPTAGVASGVEGHLAAAGAARPWDMTVSPVPLAIAALVVAALWLRGIHW